MADTTKLLQQLSDHFREGLHKIEHLQQTLEETAIANVASGVSPATMGLIVFVLSVFIGYYVVWKVTPALHSPLMSVTNAISSVIVVGAIVAVISSANSASTLFGLAGVFLASINIFGGFVITQRMLAMFNKKK